MDLGKRMEQSNPKSVISAKTVFPPLNFSLNPMAKLELASKKEKVDS
ncbi:MAG: hypothetical protein ACJZ72_04670 [Opitutales bacterium]